MNTYRFHNELPLLSQQGRILKASKLRIVSTAIELLETTKAEVKRKHQESQEEWNRQREIGFLQGSDIARREAIIHHWKMIISTVAYLESIQEQMAEAILQGVRTLIQTTPPPERALQLATAAVERLRQQAWVVLCLHPEDVDSVNGLLESWKTQLPRNMRVETRASEEVSRGDCVLESPIGRIDASLEMQLNVIRDQMQKSL